MKCIIAGSRNLVRSDPNERWKYSRDDVRLIMSTLDTIMTEIDWGEEITEVISGCAWGPDTIAKWWARDKGIEVIEMSADWDTFGKSAGFMRNSDMVDIADALIALWDGSSKGTEDVINKAISAGLIHHIETF